MALSITIYSSLTHAIYDEETVEKRNKNNIAKKFKPYVITGSLGPTWQSNGKSQDILVAQNVIKKYYANNETSVLANISIFGGFQKKLYKKLNWQLGAILEHASNANLTGEIWDDADSRFNNYTYEYSMKVTRIAAKGKILYDAPYKLQPWISSSIGISYNYAFNFLNNPIIFPAVKNFNFTKYTTQAFTYSFGAGIQRDISKHLQVGLGYEFIDWGNSRLRKAPRQTNFNTIKMDHYYTNGVLFNITYISEG